MQTVIETPPYLALARSAGLSVGELVEIVDFIAASPDAGDLMVGAGGCRKLRWAKAGRGKSGGVRVITPVSDDEPWVIPPIANARPP